MNSSLYKDLRVDGLRYHYYHHPAKSANDPTLLFLHGFPSTSEHWVHQVVYFSQKGYGVIVPDLLGYGGTSKPVDLKPYDGSTIAAHCIGILDAEDIPKAVVVSHDWGCLVGSRLANLYPERHLASVFVSVSYMPPDPVPDQVDAWIKSAKETFGVDLYSYWKFFASEESPRLLSEHENSFYSIMFTSESGLWRTDFSPEGKLKKWLLEDRIAPVAAWAPEKIKHLECFREGGWIAPTNWYRSSVQGTFNESDKDIAKDKHIITYPVLQVTSLRDAVCLPEITKNVTPAFCTNATVRDIDSGHWPMLEKPNELNAVLDEFVTSL